MRFAKRNDSSRPRVWRGAAYCLLIIIALVSSAHSATRGQKDVASHLSTDEVLEAESRLNELGYWAGDADGKWDAATRHALIAFQKVERRKRTGVLTEEELQALRAASRPRPLEGGPAHVEVDINRQVLFVVDDSGTVTKILSVSTGSGASYFDQGKQQRAHTPRGRFKVERRIAGWHRSTLGLLYYPNYFRGGFAIHGSLSVPVYPASHGCIRIPMYAAREFSDMAPVGTEVIVYDGK